MSKEKKKNVTNSNACRWVRAHKDLVKSVQRDVYIYSVNGSLCVNSFIISTLKYNLKVTSLS